MSFRSIKIRLEIKSTNLFISDLSAVQESVDMVDMFRPSEEAPQLVEDAIKLGAKIFWMQLELRNDKAAKIAEEAGMKVVMNRCPKIEYARLFGELGWVVSTPV